MTTKNLALVIVGLCLLLAAYVLVARWPLLLAVGVAVAAVGVVVAFCGLRVPQPNITLVTDGAEERELLAFPEEFAFNSLSIDGPAKGMEFPEYTASDIKKARKAARKAVGK